MYVRVMHQQQATTTEGATRATTERPARSESPDVAPRTARDELRDLARAQREAAADMRRAAEDQANRVIIREGVPVPVVPPVPGIPGIEVHAGGSSIPPQVVDLAYGAYAMLAVMVIGWPLARAWGRRLERSAHAPALSPVMGEQLQRIEQAVEAMALEVERISEAQRYLTKLQTTPAALPSGEPR
jgi:hypothetical protein